MNARGRRRNIHMDTGYFHVPGNANAFYGSFGSGLFFVCEQSQILNARDADCEFI